MIASFRRFASRPSFRPTRRPYAVPAAVESLEDRIVLSAATLAAPAPAVTTALANAINVTGVVVNDAGALVASLTVFGQAAQIPIDLTSPDVNILHLRIDAIHLDLLGLNVDTSDICLDITAHPGEGLLGDLLGGISNLLNTGGTLDQLTGAQLAGLTQTLNAVFDTLNFAGQGGAAAQQGGAAAQQVGGGQVTDILNLSLGPVDLNLLGLEVELDDCAGGPVTVDITAERGAGNLLGNLLASVAGLLDRDPGNAITAKLNKLDKVLARVADDLLG